MEVSSKRCSDRREAGERLSFPANHGSATAEVALCRRGTDSLAPTLFDRLTLQVPESVTLVVSDSVGP